MMISISTTAEKLKAIKKLGDEVAVLKIRQYKLITKITELESQINHLQEQIDEGIRS